MEDISRELEREIARAKPSPHKTSKQKRILIIDDFGELRSGDYLKVLVYLFLAVSLVGGLGTAGFYSLFSKAQKENLELKNQVSILEKKTGRLTNDKELLMARLVMAGKKPDLEPAETRVTTALPVKEKQPDIRPKPVVEKDQKQVAGVAKQDIENRAAPAVITQPEPDTSPVSMTDSQLEKESEAPAPEPVVAVEKFSVVRGKTSDELIVKFDIRNVSKKAGEISGRIFAILKPEKGGESGWVVSPGGQLENGMPGPYHEGQYFSIIRFKPVLFTINSLEAPDSFTSASIYIFEDEEKLMFENTIQINGAD